MRPDRHVHTGSQVTTTPQGSLCVLLVQHGAHSQANTSSRHQPIPVEQAFTWGHQSHVKGGKGEKEAGEERIEESKEEKCPINKKADKQVKTGKKKMLISVL